MKADDVKTFPGMTRGILMGVIVGMICISAKASGPPTAQEILAPINGGSTKITATASVNIEADTVKAASGQDAANAGVQATIEELLDSKLPPEKLSTIGARWLEFPSGDGVVATGMAVYSIKSNPVASRIDQRNAYVIAYTNARASLARFLESTLNQSEVRWQKISKAMNTEEASKNSSTEKLTEKIRESAQRLLRGFIVYEIKEEPGEDDPSYRHVYVSIVTTPKLAKSINRQGAVNAAGSLVEGIQSALDEITNGLVLPVGARTITVPTTGETAVVAFGSAIVQPGQGALRAENRLNAQKIAGARARSALHSMLGGDDVLWTQGVDEETSKSYSQSFAYAQQNDPLNQVGQQAIDYKDEFLANTEVKEAIQAMSKGRLPAGLQERSWLDSDNHWAYSLVIYTPSLTAKARGLGEKMEQGNPKNKTTETTPRTRNVDGNIPSLPGGKSVSDDDL